MKTITYHTHKDKPEWGEGPWQEEPDKIQFVDRATGLPCLIVRNHAGALCGYVGVPEGHKAYQTHYDHELLRDISVHGGLTFAGPCSGGDESTTICHVAEPGEPDNVWWLGFDCAHLGDLCPAMDARSRKLGIPPLSGQGDKYRTVNFVKRHIAKLALQLNDM